MKKIILTLFTFILLGINRVLAITYLKQSEGECQCYCPWAIYNFELPYFSYIINDLILDFFSLSIDIFISLIVFYLFIFLFYKTKIKNKLFKIFSFLIIIVVLYFYLNNLINKLIGKSNFDTFVEVIKMDFPTSLI